MNYHPKFARLETKAAGDQDDPIDELKGAFEVHDTAVKARFTDLEAKLAAATDRAERLETAFKRTASGGDREQKVEITGEAKAFHGLLRYGAEALPEVERKSLTASTDTAGGYLVHEQFASEIIKNLVQFSPVRQAARVGQMSASDMLIPVRTGAPTAVWVEETETRSGTQQAYGQQRLTAREMACYIDVSLKLLEDASFNVQDEIAMDLAEEFGRLEGLSFVSGNGVGKPIGILSDTTITTVNTGSAAAVTGDGLINALYALPPFYRNKSSWMLNGTTLASVRKLKDGNGQYLWAPGLREGQPETILGRPVVEAVDMPNEGAGLYPIVVGDFGQGYRVLDRTGMTILRDPYTQATSGLVRFHGRRRVAGDVVKAEALRIVKCST